MDKEKKVISTDGYKGVRDFYPEDMFIQKYIFKTMRDAVERFGYLEYNASILEPTELYKAKSGEEIVNEQTYSFKDRAERDVTLRPEMTPTVARMVAAKRRELSFPLRWYSIPNLFRYEKPQRGRLREHFQLNVDLFGIETNAAEIEIITVAAEIMKAFKAKPQDYEIRINNRKILNYILGSVFSLTDENAYKVMKLIDKKDKISPDEFSAGVSPYLGERTEQFIILLEARSITAFTKILSESFSAEAPGIDDATNLFEALKQRGITNAVFDPTLARGFDYYTGIVFEVRDTHTDNRRSMFGGGRYDDLLSVFGSDKVPAMGFGMGDVTIKDFLETRGLLPAYRSSADIYLCRAGKDYDKEIYDIADSLRTQDLHVAVDISTKNVGDQIKMAVKLAIPFIIVIGEDEIKDKKYKVKNLATGEESLVGLDGIVKVVKSAIQ